MISTYQLMRAWWRQWPQSNSIVTDSNAFKRISDKFQQRAKSLGKTTTLKMVITRWPQMHRKIVPLEEILKHVALIVRSTRQGNPIRAWWSAPSVKHNGAGYAVNISEAKKLSSSTSSSIMFSDALASASLQAISGWRFSLMFYMQPSSLSHYSLLLWSSWLSTTRGSF